MEAFIAFLKVSIYAAVIAAFNYLHIPTEQIGILAVLMGLDFVTGVMKQYRFDPQKIQSGRAWLGVMKKVATMIFLLSIALVLKATNIAEIQYIQTVLSILIVAEGYSITHNVYAVYSGEILPEFDVITIFLKNIQGFFEKKLKNLANVDVEMDKDLKKK